jgi:cob(I)alamin adenosyltransferase
MKSVDSGESKSIEKLSPLFVLKRAGDNKKFLREMNPVERVEFTEIQKRLLGYADEEIQSGRWDVVILDEIMAVVTENLIPKENVLSFIKNKPQPLELIMTGRNAPQEFIEIADYVSEIIAVKHPAEKGIGPRKGIEL